MHIHTHTYTHTHTHTHTPTPTTSTHTHPPHTLHIEKVSRFYIAWLQKLSRLDRMIWLQKQSNHDYNLWLKKPYYLDRMTETTIMISTNDWIVFLFILKSFFYFRNRRHQHCCNSRVSHSCHVCNRNNDWYIWPDESQINSKSWHSLEVLGVEG